MDIPSFVSEAFGYIVHPIDQLIVEPLQGLLEVGVGLTLAVPEVAAAAVNATINAIKENLDFKARLKILAGTAMIIDGLNKLQWYVIGAGIAAAVLGGSSGILLVVSVTSGTVIGLWALNEIGDLSDLLQQFGRPRAYEPAAA